MVFINEIIQSTEKYKFGIYSERYFHIVKKHLCTEMYVRSSCYQFDGRKLNNLLTSIIRFIIFINSHVYAVYIMSQTKNL